MSSIRRQSIISSGVVYFGMGLGAFTNLFLAREFTPDQYGLISGMFLAIGTIMYSFSNMGMPAYIGKFFPYYNDNLAPEKNDQITRALLIGLLGFAGVVLAGIIFRHAVIHFYEGKSAQLVRYYFWIFPFGLGLTLYSLLEAYAWQLKKSILTNYLREVQLRLNTLVLILLYLTGVLGGFSLMVKLYAFNYLVIALILLVCLIRSGEFHFVFTPSSVTKRFFSKVRSLALLSWSGGIVFTVSFFFAQVVIAAVVPGGLTSVGIFTLAQFIGSLIQAPQRGLMAAAIGPLSKAWKEKDYGRINRIYRQSSINQLIFSVGMFVLLWINFKDGVITFHLNHQYLEAQPVFLFIGFARIVDMGTGVNTQIINTSTLWRFDFITGIILVGLTIPLNYILAKEIGVTGPAIADLITFTIYNGIRWIFLYYKFKMQPFTLESLYTLLLGVAVYFVCHLAFDGHQGLLWLFIRSLCFLFLYGIGVWVLKLSEDIDPVWQTIRKRLRVPGGHPPSR